MLGRHLSTAIGPQRPRQALHEQPLASLEETTAASAGFLFALALASLRWNGGFGADSGPSRGDP
jgi:hypothetical protein